MSGELPATFGRYRVTRALGEGAMGSVYVARDEQLGRDVAVKAIRSAAMQMGGAQRFINEGRAVAQLTHPNIVRVFDVGNEAGVPYLVMELAAGGSVKDRLARGPMSIQEVRTLGIQIAHALQAAHDLGIVHRDVKPANVLEVSPGVWKLADFGIAHVPDTSLTITGQFLGSPVYAAPESIRAGLFGAASDVYGLACTLYEALTGRAPHDGRGIESRLRPDDDSAAVHRAVLSRIDAPGLVDAIARAFSSSPNDRPTPAAMAVMIAEGAPVRRTPQPSPTPAAVSTIAIADSIVTAPKERTQYVADSTIRPSRAISTRRRNIAIGVGALAVALIVIAVASRRSSAPVSSPVDARVEPVDAVAPDAAAPEPELELPPPGEIRAITPQAARENHRAAEAWQRVVEKLYEHRFDAARKRLAEWERTFGSTRETRSLHRQLDALSGEPDDD